MHQPYHNLKTAGILILILGIGCILIGALLPYGLQLKISKEINGKVKLDRYVIKLLVIISSSK